MDKEITTTTFRSPKTLLQDLKEQANKRGTSINALLLIIVWEWLKANKN